MWHIHGMEFLSSHKENKIVMFVVKWMQLEIVMLHEISLTLERQILVPHMC